MQLDKDLVLKKLKPLLEDPSIKKIGQNIKFDFIVFFKHGICLINGRHNVNVICVRCWKK